MGSLRIDICNERLLPRFGVDRLLVLLARRLADAGHEVGFACLRCDEAMLLPITQDVSVIPMPQGLDMAGTEANAAGAMAYRWRQRKPDVVVIGGWPFFQTGAQAATHQIESVFIDAGAVAQDGFPEPLLTMQRELRRIRQLTLPAIHHVLPISDFIRYTQTEPDRGGDAGVRTILLGGDHMALGTFGGDQQGGKGRDLVQLLEAGKGKGERLLLGLGRYESQGYKNSAAGYEVFRRVREQVPTARLLLLDAGEDCQVPAELEPYIYLLGAPDDLTLQEIMVLCEAGFSTSLWEGFNLPIAEMQWLDRPAVAFNLAAHPEVIAEPWLLCHDVKEMAGKLVALLRDVEVPNLASRFAAFRQRRQWKFTLTAWESEITEAARRLPALAETPPGDPRERRIVLVDVTNASLDPANPGVIRVVRRLCSELQHDERIELIFAAWNRDLEEFTFLDQTRRNFLESYGGPKDGLGVLSAWKADVTPERLIERIRIGRLVAPVLFLPEVLFDGQAEARVNWAQVRGFKSAAILHDLIPIYYPELCDPSVCAGFPSYLEALARVDAVWSNSEYTIKEFRRYHDSSGPKLPPIHEAIHLPGQFSEYPRNTNVHTDNYSHETRMLFVSTLEPRKNHIRLLEAFERLRVRRPELRLRLVLIGNHYAGAPEIAEHVQGAVRRDNSIEWLGTIDDTRLAAEFEKCSFTVYPSLVEGYGLPIVESLWMGRPCLTNNAGVMQELAVPGGCLTADMTDSDSIMLALERMATDVALLARLRDEACERKIATWRDYSEEIAGRLVTL